MKRHIKKLLEIYLNLYTKKRFYDNGKTGTAFNAHQVGKNYYVSIKGSDTQIIDWVRNIFPSIVFLAFAILSFKNIYFLIPAFIVGTVHIGFLLLGIEVFRNIDRSLNTYYLYGHSWAVVARRF